MANQQDEFKRQKAQFEKQKQERKLRIAAMKEELEERELRARFAKANWEIMTYSIEGEKLQPEYKKFLDREEQKRLEAEKQREEFFATLKKAQEDAANGKTPNAEQEENFANELVEESQEDTPALESPTLNGAERSENEGD